MIKMAKLYYRYSAMNAGKSTLAMQVAHNYEEKGGKIVVFKPLIDTKGNKTIVSRIGISRTVDHLLSKEESPIKIIKDIADLDAIIVDEAQFLEPFQIDELYYIAKKMNISVLCFGLRCDFQMQVFPGSARLLAIADSIEEIKTKLKELKKARWEEIEKSGIENEINKEEPRCPNCDSILKKYVYGRVKGEINIPKYYCSKCCYDINFNPMITTLDKLIKYPVNNDPFWNDLLKKILIVLVIKIMRKRLISWKNWF